jgi:hypothetical protein
MWSQYAMLHNLHGCLRVMESKFRWHDNEVSLLILTVKYSEARGYYKQGDEARGRM